MDAYEALEKFANEGAIDVQYALEQIAKKINEIKDAAGGASGPNGLGGLEPPIDDAGKAAEETANKVRGIGNAAATSAAEVRYLANQLKETREAIGFVQSAMSNLIGDMKNLQTGAMSVVGSLGAMKYGLEENLSNYSSQYNSAATKYNANASSAGTRVSGSGVSSLRNKTGSIIISRSHVGEPVVTKEVTPLDKALGVKQDETLRILKVGEAVIPPEENINRIAGKNSSVEQNVSKVASQITNTSKNISNNNNSEAINLNMGDIVIQGNADQNTVEALRKERDSLAQAVFAKIEKHSKQGGFRNMKLSFM